MARSSTAISESEAVRNHVRATYLQPALRRHEKRFIVNIGAVHKALALSNRVPLVCAALQSRRFLEENALRIVSKTGPPSGQSTTVTITYEILVNPQKAAETNPLDSLRGIATDLFKRLGGGEAFIRNERNSFSDRGHGES